MDINSQEDPNEAPNVVDLFLITREISDYLKKELKDPILRITCNSNGDIELTILFKQKPLDSKDWEYYNYSYSMRAIDLYRLKEGNTRDDFLEEVIEQNKFIAENKSTNSFVQEVHVPSSKSENING